MFIEKIKSEDLAHLSYLVGSGNAAAVIDPRRDCQVYLDIAAANSCRITHIFETHRNEDLLTGSAVLREITSATVYHGPNAAGEISYAEVAHEGDTYDLGQVCIKVLETPGHTDDSLSFVVIDTDSGKDPVAVFTGDALFIGDVGRTDFYPDRAREVAGLLYDSLQKLLNLGDQTVLYPAHGAGSVCGSGMADREVSTIGYERANNPRLQIANREAFIDFKVNEHHYVPPYFRYMEELNLVGASEVREAVPPSPLSAQAVEKSLTDATVVDVRSAAAFLGAHLPGSIALPAGTVGAFAGWLLRPEDELILVADDARQAHAAALSLARIGYDNIRGFLAASLAAWAAQGQQFVTIPVVDAEEVKNRLDNAPENWTLVDVRAIDEVESERVEPSQHIYVGELPIQADKLDKNRRYTVMCGSGSRATIGASLLLRAGCHNVDLFLGSMKAWKHRDMD